LWNGSDSITDSESATFMTSSRLSILGLIFLLGAASFAHADDPPLRPQMPDVPGSTLIQLGAERSEVGAATIWARIAHRTNGILDGLSPRITPVQVLHTGVFYRLRAGPLDAVNAASICAALKAREIACIVVR
jgi:hypothetical protein